MFVCLTFNHFVHKHVCAYTDVVLQLRLRIAEHIKGDTVSDSPPAEDGLLGQCVWWKPTLDSHWFKGVITSKDLEHAGEILYHVRYDDGDEADLELYELEDTEEYTFTSPDTLNTESENDDESDSDVDDGE